MVAKFVVQIFPNIKMVKCWLIDIFLYILFILNQWLFTHVTQTALLNSTDGGKLAINLRNQRVANKRNNNTANTEDQLDGTEADKLFETMKLTIVNNGSMDNFKSMLSQTLVYRSKLLKNIEINLREYFPYFFVSPELVI